MDGETLFIVCAGMNLRLVCANLGRLATLEFFGIPDSKHGKERDEQTERHHDNACSVRKFDGPGRVKNNHGETREPT